MGHARVAVDAQRPRADGVRQGGVRCGAQAGRRELEVVQLDPNNGAWLLDQPPLVATEKFTAKDEWEARTQQARTSFGGA